MRFCKGEAKSFTPELTFPKNLGRLVWDEWTSQVQLDMFLLLLFCTHLLGSFKELWANSTIHPYKSTKNEFSSSPPTMVQLRKKRMHLTPPRLTAPTPRARFQTLLHCPYSPSMQPTGAINFWEHDWPIFLCHSGFLQTGIPLTLHI